MGSHNGNCLYDLNIDLTLESGSYGALIEKVKNALFELVELNNLNKIKSIQFVSKRLDLVA